MTKSKSIELAERLVDTISQYQEECEFIVTIDDAGKALMSTLGSFIVDGAHRLENVTSFEKFTTISDVRDSWIQYFTDIIEIMYVNRSKQGNGQD